MDEFLDAYVAKYCEWGKRCRGIERCDERPTLLDGAQHLRAVIPGEVAAGRLAYDPEEGLRCLQAHFGCGNLPGFMEVCEPVFRGLVELGGECYAPDLEPECAEGVCAGNTCPGRCTLDALREDGEVCGRGSCKAGSLCGVIKDGAYVCGPERAKGESCDERSVCTPGSYCSNGTCAEHIAHGARCADDYQCGPNGTCRGPSRESMVCMGEGSAGDACESGEALCDAYSTCISVESLDARCVAKVGLGESCMLADCHYGLRCDREHNHVCVTAGNLGDPCTKTCDFPLLCLDGVCRNGAEVGERCESEASCRRGLFCHSKGVCREPSRMWEACDPKGDGDVCEPFSAGCMPISDRAGAAFLCRPHCEGPNSVAPPNRPRLRFPAKGPARLAPFYRADWVLKPDPG